MIYFFSTEEGFLNKKGTFKISNPVYKLIYKNSTLYLNDKKFHIKNPFILIEKILKESRLYAAGFISYEYGEKLQNIRNQNKKLIDLPDIYVVFFRKLVSFSFGFTIKSKIITTQMPVSKNSFIRAIKEAKNYIEKGDIYQINLSLPLVLRGYFHKESIFQNLIKIQPAPYLMLIKEKDFSLISGSMELFLRKKSNLITTKPIKGTRPRGKTEKEDLYLYKELLSSKKEKAENLMITDLMRNDLGRISKIGSVKVKKLFHIEKYSSLFQMSSIISSSLKEGISLKDIINATFPPGSVTGAPKKRAMEIIAQLEEYKRSVYCGATFLISPDLDFTMSVAIRQILFQKDKAVIFVGSGIVADSNPEKEYEETMLKAKANLNAIYL